MIGIPFLGGFTAKVFFAQAAMGALPIRMILTLVVLAISTALNAVYFGKTILTIYRVKPEHVNDQPHYRPGVLFTGACVGMIGLNVVMGVCAQPIYSAILNGLRLFG